MAAKNTWDEIPPSRDNETLDPADWDALADLGHRMVDDVVEYLKTIRERPVWQPVPESIRQAFKAPLPTSGQPAETVYDEFLQQVVGYSPRNAHPRFWGWVEGNGTPLGAFADMLAAGLNPNMGSFEQAPVYVERQVLDWMKEILGFPMTASGILVSGGSVANLVGLAVARSARAPFDVRRDGLARGQARLVMYSSEAAHSSIVKAAELLGLGRESLRLLPVDSDYTLDPSRLREAVEEDRRSGLHPFAVVANVGTVETGAVDDVGSLTRYCREEKLWLHVDGAFGALLALSPTHRHRVAALAHADSVAFDLHKWVYLPYEIGCVLVADEKLHRSAFDLSPSYLAHGDRGIMSGPPPFRDYGLQLSRGFRALKAWMVLKAEGTDKIGRLIEKNLAQAAFLAAKIEEEPALELLTPVSMNIVCFRCRFPELSEPARNDLNEELLLRLQESGNAAPSSVVLDGRFAFRVAITNHRTRREDLTFLLQQILRIGRELTAARPPRKEPLS